MSLTTHTCQLPASKNAIVEFDSFEMVSEPILSQESDSIVDIYSVKIAALVDTSKPKITYKFFINHTGQPISESVTKEYELSLVGYRRVNDQMNVYGLAVYKLTKRNNRTLNLTASFRNPNLAASTLSMVLNDIISRKLQIDDSFVKEHLGFGQCTHDNSSTQLTLLISEEFFCQYYGPLVQQLRSIPAFTSCTFTENVK